MARITLKDRIKALNATVRLLKKGWTPGYLALDENGDAVGTLDPNACLFCLDGAMRRICQIGSDGDKKSPLYDAITKDVLREMDTGKYKGKDGYAFYGYIDFNDDQDEVGPVLKLVRNTVRSLKKRLDRRAAA